eukprot:12924599-Ditylum_brightwellii.AAC.1
MPLPLPVSPPSHVASAHQQHVELQAIVALHSQPSYPQVYLLPLCAGAHPVPDSDHSPKSQQT